MFEELRGHLGALVDLIGKLGPLFVAIAVYWTNRRQIAWSNRMAKRSADVDDQRLRLSLLDRRLAAIEAVGACSQEYFSKGQVTDDAVRHLHVALNRARVVFEDSDLEAIQEVQETAIRWRRLERKSKSSAGSHDEDSHAEFVDKIISCEEALIAQLDALNQRLYAGSRVSTVPPA